MSLRISSGSGFGVINLRIAAKGFATKSVLTNQRHDRPSVSSALARASRVTCSKRAACADDRGSIRRNSTRKTINEPSTSAIVIAVITLDFDVYKLADKENTDHHHAHTTANH